MTNEQNRDPRSVEAMEEALKRRFGDMYLEQNSQHEIGLCTLDHELIAIFDLRDCVKLKKLEEQKS